MLEIKNLKASRDNKKILNGINLKIKPNEVHAIMGPNGSGKSTLANAVMGNPDIVVESGEVLLDKQDILDLEVNDRAKKGLFMAFQYPVEVPGVPLTQFLKLVYETKNNTKITPGKFLQLVNEKAEQLKIKKELLSRYLNEGFSGGEKKKVEILQMALFEPKFAVLDETDSGLDISALKIVAEGVNKVKEDTKMGVLVITHYSRILNYLKPDYVHILKDGEIIKSGGMEIAEQLEKDGYEGL